MAQDQNGEKSQIIDFNQARTQKLDEKRRKTERIFFKSLISVYADLGQGNLKPIELIEVSEEGCSFQVPFDSADVWLKGNKGTIAGDTFINVRLYFSQDTYLQLTLSVKNSRPCIDQGTRYIRYGCAIDQSLSTYGVYQQFVKFLKLYSESAHKDTGDGTVFYI